VCYSTCEGTNLVVFLSLFSKMFSSFFFNRFFVFFFFFELFLDNFFFVDPCPTETFRGSNHFVVFLNTLFYPLYFCDKNGEYFLIWTKIVFLTGQGIFVPE
jgi:hypothetical protein